MIRKPWPALLVAAVLVAIACVLAPKHLDASIELAADQLHSAPEQSEIVISGRNDLARPAIIVLRVDDKAAPPYFDRANIERKIPPGPFRFRIPIGLLKTPKGRHLNRNQITRAIAFSVPEDPDVAISTISIENTPKLGGLLGDVIALDFGSQVSPVFPGFAKITPGASIVHGPHQKALARPGTDSLISDGISGVERITLTVPPGQWTLTLWTEDLGEWEYMPHFLERRIQINGRTIHHERRQPNEWIQDIYLRGRDREWRPGESAWDSFGQHRGGQFEATVDAPDGKIIIELAGDRLSATHVAGLLLHPANKPEIRARVKARREVRFNESWRVADVEAPEPSPPGGSIAFTSPRVTAAPGTLAFIPLTITSAKRLPLAFIGVEQPVHDKKSLPVTIFAGHWRLTRPNAASTLLVPDDRHYRGDITTMTVGPVLPRNIILAVTIPSKTPPGFYEGAITFGAQQAVYAIEVLDVALPPADAAIGVYYDHSPLHDWFNTDPSPATRCALRTFRWLGLTSVAPPFETPRAEGEHQKFERDLDLAKTSGIDGPYLAYAPLKRLLAKEGWREALPRLMGKLDDQAGQVIWSAADEVSNLGGDHAALRASLADIRSVAPTILLAGHLNAPRDRSIVDAFDVVLINAGFGLDPGTISRAKRNAKSVLLYNMERPRLASGFYLWRTGLDGYLQWHANMATADPFDPTDGREADIAWLYPTADPCSAVPDIDRGLLEMAEGIIDFRWLRWLDQKALRNANAAALRDAIQREISERWNLRKSLNYNDLAGLRGQIIEMARTLH